MSELSNFTQQANGNPAPYSGAPPTDWGSVNNPVSGVNMNFGGQSLGLNDPGMMNPGQLNPYAQQYMQNNQNLMSQMQGSMLNPQQYAQLQGTQQQNLTTSLDNQYAAMGLSGSSAEMGGVAQAVNQNQMSWLNRQQGDERNYASAMSGLNQQGYGDLMGIQNQYGNFQDAYSQDVVGLYGIQQGAQAANNQMWGQMVSGGLQAGGMAAMAFA